MIDTLPYNALKLIELFSFLDTLVGTVFEVVPDYKGSYAAYVMKKSHPTPDMLARKYVRS